MRVGPMCTVMLSQQSRAVDRTHALGSFSEMVPHSCQLKKRASIRILFAGLWLIISIAVVAVIWVIDADRNKGGTQAVLHRDHTHLPQISQVGGAPPAYYLFCTALPVASIVVWSPMASYLRGVVRALEHLGLPKPHRLRCFFCCCCCCIDDQRGIDSNRFTCAPYLPYVAIALLPLYSAAVISLTGLSVLSIYWFNAYPHGFFAFVFFASMISFHGSWLFTINAACKQWGAACKEKLGVDNTGIRFKIHTGIFIAEAFVFTVAWIGSTIVVDGISIFTKIDGPSKVQNRWANGPLEYLLVFLMCLDTINIAFDIDAFPDDKVQDLQVKL